MTLAISTMEKAIQTAPLFKPAPRTEVLTDQSTQPVTPIADDMSDYTTADLQTISTSSAASVSVNRQRTQGNFALIMTSALHIYPLSNGVNMIGREQDCRIRLADPVVSRQHAKIVLNGHALILTDMNSTNGTFLNGKRVTTSKILQGGDRVKLGNVEFVVAG